jgi:hypothetical protein
MPFFQPIINRIIFSRYKVNALQGPFVILLVINICFVKQGDLMRLKVQPGKKSMVMCVRISKMNELGHLFIGIQHGMHLNTAFALTIGSSLRPHNS